jgi:hypothetical protein
MLISGLVLVGAVGSLLYRRYAPEGLFARLTAPEGPGKPGRKH